MYGFVPQLTRPFDESVLRASVIDLPSALQADHGIARPAAGLAPIDQAAIAAPAAGARARPGRLPPARQA